MDKGVSIVPVDQRHYRRIAQENWGLTKEQMRGKHVHHRIPVSEGGTNDPTNLYVCSEWFHAHVWHSEDGLYGLTSYAREGGRKGGLTSRTGQLTLLKGTGLFGMSDEEKAIARKNGGLTAYTQGTACHAPEIKGKGARKTNSTYWEDPDHPELGVLQAGPLAMKQKSRGLPHGPENRKRVYRP